MIQYQVTYPQITYLSLIENSFIWLICRCLYGFLWTIQWMKCAIFRYYEDDQEVESDNELQELVNELSADGKHGNFGGNGMVGFMLMNLKQFYSYLNH